MARSQLSNDSLLQTRLYSAVALKSSRKLRTSRFSMFAERGSSRQCRVVCAHDERDPDLFEKPVVKSQT